MNWSELWNNMINLQPSIAEIALRLACAMLVGLVIGTEREYTHRPAGMRTHILVALGACVVSITGELLFHQYNATVGAVPDPARLSAQVITGVGFLGAGTIMREGINVKGLTTAASVWAVACLGIAAGFGYYLLALIGMGFIFITLTLFEWFQHKLIGPDPVQVTFLLETSDLSQTLELLEEKGTALRINLSEMHIKEASEIWQITFTARFLGKEKKTPQNYMKILATHPATKAISLSDRAEEAVH